jgi:hypothetical protein
MRSGNLNRILKSKSNQGKAHLARAPAKIGKNMIFLHKIVIFNTKYPKKFRTSLRLAQFFKVRVDIVERN